jgi:hypothetical protein
MVRAAAPARARRHLSASSATTPTAPVHATINTTISTTWSSSAAAPRTTGAAFTASAAPTSTSTAVPIPLPPPSVVLPRASHESSSCWYLAAVRCPSRILNASRWTVREPRRCTRRRPLLREHTFTRRLPLRMWPVPLHLPQRLNGARYSHPHPQGEGGDGEQDQMGVHRRSSLRHGHASGVTLAVPGGAAGHLAVCCNASPGCRSVWYRPAL